MEQLAERWSHSHVPKGARRDIQINSIRIRQMKFDLIHNLYDN